MWKITNKSARLRAQPSPRTGSILMIEVFYNTPPLPVGPLLSLSFCVKKKRKKKKRERPWRDRNNTQILSYNYTTAHAVCLVTRQHTRALTTTCYHGCGIPPINQYTPPRHTPRERSTPIIQISHRLQLLPSFVQHSTTTDNPCISYV